MKYIRYESKDFIGTLTINRPEALNALNGETLAEISQILGEITSTGLRCLVITGGGEKSFVAGADIREMLNLMPQNAREYSETGNRLMDAIDDFPAPVIAAVNGYALGGGFELALACDIRMAAENAVFAFPEVSLGILPGYGGIKRIAALIGAARAKELLFTARRVTAAEALSLGIVNSVHPQAELMGEVLKTAARIAGNAPLGVGNVKKAANAAAGLTAPEFTEREAALFQECFGTQDQRNAMSAFLEKRKPAPFTGACTPVTMPAEL
ncbi:MAG: enoyl-CoA hydratase/isomerase family protein [Treponema sp.]|jgi:enoyl-CoA hydratase|nr:enoyl-CoA hydratase/isomerase family protein [Treponema sp.]